MARLRADIKAAFLEVLWETSGDGLTVLEVLSSFRNNSFQRLQSGRVVSSTSGGGYSTSFEGLVTTLEMTPVEVLALGQELIKIYRDAISNVQGLSDDGGSGSDAVIQSMLADDRMQTVRQEMLDVTGLRFYVQGGTV